VSKESFFMFKTASDRPVRSFVRKRGKAGGRDPWEGLFYPRKEGKRFIALKGLVAPAKTSPQSVEGGRKKGDLRKKRTPKKKKSHLRGKRKKLGNQGKEVFGWCHSKARGKGGGRQTPKGGKRG